MNSKIKTVLFWFVMLACALMLWWMVRGEPNDERLRLGIFVAVAIWAVTMTALVFRHEKRIAKIEREYPQDPI